MKVKIRKIERKEEEQVIIECVKVTPQVEDICAYARSRGEVLYGIVRMTRLRSRVSVSC